MRLTVEVDTRLVQRLFSGSPPPTVSTWTLGQLVDEKIREATGQGLSIHYTRGLRQYLCSFAHGREAQTVSETLTLAKIQEWFASRSEAASTRASNIGRLSSLCDLAVRLDILPSNPCRKIKPPRLQFAPPLILSPASAADLLNRATALCPEILGWIVLCLFCAIRPYEALAVPWSAVDPTTATVRLERTKTGRRRLVPLPPNAVAWLQCLEPRTGMVCPSWSTIRRRRKSLMHPWPPDILRHTSISYMLAAHQDSGKVATWAGTSPRMVREHYTELVTPADARRFWKIEP